MNNDEKMKLFQEKKRHHLAMGGEKKLKARKAESRLNARERLDYLFDPGTFLELGLFAHSALPGMEERTPADGKIIGYGLVEGRPVGVVANDMTVMGASSSVTNMKKIEYMRSVSCEKGMPLVFLGESAGARIPDCMGSEGMAHGGQNPSQYRRLRESPWVSVLLGPCYGSSTWYSAMSDITVMLKGAVMAVSSPKVTSLAVGEETPPEELGGWKLHSEVSSMSWERRKKNAWTSQKGSSPMSPLMPGNARPEWTYPKNPVRRWLISSISFPRNQPASTT
jgi:acetyl-CoA carboxylase carboxyltransferase component